MQGYFSCSSHLSMVSFFFLKKIHLKSSFIQEFPKDFCQVKWLNTSIFPRFNWSCHVISESSIDNDENISRVADDTTINVDAQGPVKFSVWVSYAEIYNETIFDLLEPCPTGKGKKRTTLRLGDDANGNPYIKGMCWIKTKMEPLNIALLFY